MFGHFYTEALNFPTFHWTEALPHDLIAGNKPLHMKVRTFEHM
jgi:hypothetical protein